MLTKTDKKAEVSVIYEDTIGFTVPESKSCELQFHFSCVDLQEHFLICRSFPGELGNYSVIINYGAYESGKENFHYKLVCCVSEDLKEFLF